MGKMAEIQRRLLEQMMGPEAMGIKAQNYDWWDERVCRNFLFGTCPHLVFGNTKMDIGPCPKIHSDTILKQFNEALAAVPRDPRIAIFKQEHENNVYGFVDDCDRRIKMAQRKLEKTPEENRKTVDLMKEIGEIELAIQGGTEEIEALGEAGKVEESMEKLAAVEALKGLKTDKEKEMQHLNETAGASGHQKLRVCETCGAMLSVLDSDKRLADHFGGKMHLGYHELRKLLSQLADERMAARQGPPPQGPPGHGYNPHPNGPNGPNGAGPPRSQAPPSAPSGPSSRPPQPQEPQTPMHSKVPPADEMPHVGHGDKVKREAGELVEDVKIEKGERYDGDRDRERERRHRHRDEEGGDRYEKHERSSSGRHDGDRRERERSDRGDRDRDRDRSERSDRGDRDRKYDDDRRRDRERSRSPAKRRVL